jgi:hypothetical protein
MHTSLFSLRFIEQEVVGLIHRTQMVRPFALHDTMVPAAQPMGNTTLLIDQNLSKGRNDLIAAARSFLNWLGTREAERTRIDAVYRRYVFLRLQMTASLTQYDLFADALTQRSEADTGVMLAGLDELAHDSLRLAHSHFQIPPLLCYLDRGIGAAIRRARTRLPGGGESPAAIIRVPRERMVGLGIASSLVHEAGHQGAALLNLVPTLRTAMEPMLRGANNSVAQYQNPWLAWYRWISEIVADLWSVSRVGMASTLGLINVVSLPKVFVFRPNVDAPHPTPWIRVLLSSHMGNALYPHPQWARLRELWLGAYPMSTFGVPFQPWLQSLATHVPIFVEWMLRQRIPNAENLSLSNALRDGNISPVKLDEALDRWQRDRSLPARLRPCQIFALVGFARAVRGSSPEPEPVLFSNLLTHWALNRPSLLTVHN